MEKTKANTISELKSEEVKLKKLNVEIAQYQEEYATAKNEATKHLISSLHAQRNFIQERIENLKSELGDFER